LLAVFEQSQRPCISAVEHLHSYRWARLDNFLSDIGTKFDLSECKQIMTEVSPYTIDKDKIAVLRSHGLNKVTIGIQSLDQAVLKANNRLQDYGMVERAFGELRLAGVKYINADMMVGIPGQSVKSFLRSLDQLIKLAPDTIHINPFKPTSFTLFSLAKQHIDSQTLSNRKIMLGLGRQMIASRLPDAEEVDHLEKENLQIFNSNRYNRSLLGLGWGAISHVNGRMSYYKPHTYGRYIEDVGNKGFPACRGVILTVNDEMRANAG
jgi:oxygen-independent coproporphyrinogen III oxidase